MSKQRRYAILGYPVSHSLSPLFYNNAFRRARIDSLYEFLETPPGSLKNIFEPERLKEFSGFNVTIPHKVDVMRFLTDVSEDASALGAVNTIVVDGERTRGFNTDVIGIERTLEHVAAEVAGTEVCLFGAGGAARAVLRALDRSIHPRRVTVVNRDTSRLNGFLRTVPSNVGFETEGMSLEDPGVSRKVAAAKLVIQSTSVGMHPNVEDCILREADVLHDKQIVFDLVYTPPETRLIREAERRGARTIGGLQMFLVQAAAAFEMFTGHIPDLNVLGPILEAELRKRTANLPAAGR